MPEPGNPDEENPVKENHARMDLATLIGLAVALGGLVGGLLLEGGRLKDVAQLTSAMIVFGGTAGAVLVSIPIGVLKGGLRRLKGVFRDSAPPLGDLIEEVIGYAAKARKNGLVSLEEQALEIEEPFLRKALNLAVDGTDLEEIRRMLELEIGLEEQQADAEAKVFDCAGGYAPTIGIIGAVIGLIQVMKNLANIDEVGRGIAVSFVATVYGVGSANLLFLPAATKIKARARAETQRKELILEGVSGIVEGMNPKLIRSKLEAYACDPEPRKIKTPNQAGHNQGAEAPVRAQA